MIWWNRDAETLPREQPQCLQLERLKTTVSRILERVPPMQARLRAAGVSSAADVTSLEDLDELTVVCEPSAAVADAEGLRGRVARAVQAATGLTVRVDVAAVGSIPRSEGKAVRVVDRRFSRQG